MDPSEWWVEGEWWIEPQALAVRRFLFSGSVPRVINLQDEEGNIVHQVPVEVDAVHRCSHALLIRTRIVS